MKECCKDIYKQTLEEVLKFITSKPDKSIAKIIQTLNYAINMISEQKENEFKSN